MKRAATSFLILLSILHFCAASNSQTQAANVQNVVDQFYPQKYVDDANRQGEQLNHKTCHAVYQVLSNGEPQVIIAGYADGYQGTIKVLTRKSPGVYTVAYEPAGLFLGGIDCRIELVDVDGDGINEVHVSFTSARGIDGDWIFKWDGLQLRSIGPMSQRKGIAHTKLANASIEDLYHDGTMAIFSVSLTPPPIDASVPTTPDSLYLLYRLSGGKYVLDTPVVEIADFPRATMKPQAEPASFDLPKGSTGPYQLRVVNGDASTKNRVSSGHIWVNGSEFVKPNQLNQQVGIFTVPLPPLLQTGNQLTVKIESAPGSHITVLIEDHTLGFLNPQQ
jgi:hypothetical protein